MADPQVLILGTDIFPDYVERLHDITIEKTFEKLKLISNSYSLPVLNRDNQFSINNPVSMFNGANWLHTPIQIIGSDGEDDFIGGLVKITRNHFDARATLLCKDTFYKFRDDVIEYQSSDWETGADVFKNICDNVGYTDYNESAYSRSNAILDNANCFIKVNFNKSSNVTFQNAINRIALYSNAFVFNENNKTHFKVWEYVTGGVSFDVYDADLKGNISVYEDESNLYNDYQISYFEDLGTPATDSANNNIGSVSRTKNGTNTIVLRTGNNNQIIFKDLTSAVFVGEGKIRRTHKDLLKNPKPLSVMIFSLFKDFEDKLSVDSYFYMNYDREAFNQKIFEPFKYTISQTRDDISITAYEVAT